jgi:hypothetical protein
MGAPAAARKAATWPAIGPGSRCRSGPRWLFPLLTIGAAVQDARHGYGDGRQRARSDHLSGRFRGPGSYRHRNRAWRVPASQRSGPLGCAGSCCLRLVLVTAAARTPPAECVLDLLAGLLQVAFHLIGPALGLATPVAGDLASVPLDSAAQFLCLVAEFVRETHNRPHPRRRGWPAPMLGPPPGSSLMITPIGTVPTGVFRSAGWLGRPGPASPSGDRGRALSAAPAPTSLPDHRCLNATLGQRTECRARTRNETAVVGVLPAEASPTGIPRDR